MCCYLLFTRPVETIALALLYCHETQAEQRSIQWRRVGIECIAEFDAVYVQQVEGADMHLLLLLELFSMKGAAESQQQSCHREWKI